MRNWNDLIDARWQQGLYSCVGLDLDIARFPKQFRTLEPADALVAFGTAIVEATGDSVGAFKPNIAYFEQYGSDGIAALIELIKRCHVYHPEVPVILDAKRADIASTNDGYVKSIFGVFNADATTVHPFLGSEALRPFLDQHGKGIFVLCRTSNPGAGELQDLTVEGEPLYLRLARSVANDWTANATLGLVVGATYPDELERVRRAAPHVPLLVPGIGAQGGDLEATVRTTITDSGGGVLINSSRAILYASDRENFADAARGAVTELNAQIALTRPGEDA
jgi:orotidine-5'-phosphate decarboxylase